MTFTSLPKTNGNGKRKRRELLRRTCNRGRSERYMELEKLKRPNLVMLNARTPINHKRVRIKKMELKKITHNLEPKIGRIKRRNRFKTTF